MASGYCLPSYISGERCIASIVSGTVWY